MQNWRRWVSLPDHQVTDEQVFRQRRRFMQVAAGVSVGAVAGCSASDAQDSSAPLALGQKPLNAPLNEDYSKWLSDSDKLTPESDALRYNNFYELGLGKEDPSKNAALLKTSPWQVKVSGECDKPGDYHLEDILSKVSIEQRIYRLRCVEAWSMVIPWDGFSLADLLKVFAPNSRARYVAFETLLDPENLPGQRQAILDWPYREGLRIDEAMNPLTMLAVGAYGKTLAPQMGAPLRLVVPWKYGFKSIKSIVGIRFSETEPRTSWNLSAPREYGFYANVNPAVSHPRWSQAQERRLDGGGLFAGKIPTQAYNGYGDAVASMYQGMDLSRYF